MELAGRAAFFINELDQRQQSTIEQINVEMGRMNDRVNEMTILKDGIEKTHTNLLEFNAGTTAFAESTRAELAAGAVANEEAHQKVEVAHQKANHVHTQVNDLFAKTELTFAENEKNITDLRDAIRVWSDNFAA